VGSSVLPHRSRVQAPSTLAGSPLCRYQLSLSFSRRYAKWVAGADMAQPCREQQDSCPSKLHSYLLFLPQTLSGQGDENPGSPGIAQMTVTDLSSHARTKKYSKQGSDTDRTRRLPSPTPTSPQSWGCAFLTPACLQPWVSSVFPLLPISFLCTCLKH
jgi:hypothetical protein